METKSLPVISSFSFLFPSLVFFSLFFSFLDILNVCLVLPHVLTVISTTEKNVSRTAELDALYQQLTSKKETRQQLQDAVRVQQARQNEVMQRLSPAVLLDRLVEAAQAAELESDDIASHFLDSVFLFLSFLLLVFSLFFSFIVFLACPYFVCFILYSPLLCLGSSTEEHKEFIKKFTEKRRLYHLRAAKKESTLMSLNQKRQ